MTIKSKTLPVQVAAVVAITALAAAVALSVTGDEAGRAIRDHAGALAIFVAITLVLQACSLTAFSSSISVSGLGMLAVGFSFGTGPAMATALLAACVHAARKRPAFHKAVFNAACFTLAAGAAVGIYQLLDGPDASGPVKVALAALASGAFVAVNVGLLTVAMAVAEQLPPLDTWRQRLRWISPAYLAFGPLALVTAVVYANAGAFGVVVLALAGAVLTAALQQALVRARRVATVTT